MYLKTKWISFLKVKNALLLLTGLFLVFTGIADIISLIVYYWGDWDTVIHARSTPEAVCGFFVGIVMLMIRTASKNEISKANFYSSYFESDLYGKIYYNELSEITGFDPRTVKSNLHFLRIFYMKRFSFSADDSGEYIELFSKTVVCSCKNCGAVIDKKIYFTGICPYCKTSDVFATVLTDNKVYNILGDAQSSKSQAVYYLRKNIFIKRALMTAAVGFSALIVFILIMVIIDSAGNYNDQQYLKDLLLSGKSYSSYELIKKQILDGIVWDTFFIMIFLPLIFISVKKLILIDKSQHYAELFAESHSPFLDLSVIKNSGSVKTLRRCLQSGYLRNCTLEKHDNILTISLAKKIVKDSCPYCGAPVTGAVNENYFCGFCGNRILRVIDKK